LHWYGRATGTGHFTDDDWALSNRGNLKVGDTISCGDLHTTDDIQVGDRIDAAGDIAAGNDLTAVQFARIGGEYRYTSAKARNTIIPLASAYGAVFKNFQSYLVMGGSDTVSIAVKLPHGAILNSVDVMYSKAGTASVDVYAVRRSGANWTTATPPTNTQVGHTFSTAGIGNYVINVPFGGLTISKDEDYEVVVSDGDSGDHLHGFRVNWTDPGPQNF
jgi:hypothetical protein